MPLGKVDVWMEMEKGEGVKKGQVRHGGRALDREGWRTLGGVWVRGQHQKIANDSLLLSIHY